MRKRVKGIPTPKLEDGRRKVKIVMEAADHRKRMWPCRNIVAALLYDCAPWFSSWGKELPTCGGGWHQSARKW